MTEEQIEKLRVKMQKDSWAMQHKRYTKEEQYENGIFLFSYLYLMNS